MASEASGLPFPTITLAGGSTIFRVHRVGKRPVFFGPRPGSPPGSRFDAPGGQYRTLYAAERLDGAVAETLLREPAKRLIRLSDIADRAWVGLRVTRPLLLVKLMDEGLRWHGVDASISASAGYRKPRSLALSLYRSHPVLDGIAYRSRHSSGFVCFSIFDRVQPGDIDAGPSRCLIGDLDSIRAIFAQHGAAIDESEEVPLAPDE